MREDKLSRFSDPYAIKKTNANFLVYHYLIRDLKYAIQKYANGKVLDIGCGNKPYYALFEGKISAYIGCDVVQSSLQKVDVICEATQIPLANESFDTAFSTQAIEHVYDHRRLVSEANRLLKMDGIFILSGPMYWHLHEEPYDFFRFTKYGFTELLQTQGFEVLEILPNGGKWAVLGTVILQTVPLINTLKITKWLINSICLWLDTKYFDATNTLNYVVIAKKVSLKVP
jgi:SAM-dependent methyltransferase